MSRIRYTFISTSIKISKQFRGQRHETNERHQMKFLAVVKNAQIRFFPPSTESK